MRGEKEKFALDKITKRILRNLYQTPEDF